MNLCWKANSTVATSSDAASLRGVLERISRFIIVVVINVVAGSSSLSLSSAASVRQKLTKNPETVAISVTGSPKTRLQFEGQRHYQHRLYYQPQHSSYQQHQHHQASLKKLHRAIQFQLTPSSVADGDPPRPAAIGLGKLASTVGIGKKEIKLVGDDTWSSSSSSYFIPFTSQSEKSALFVLDQFVAIFLLLLTILVAVLHNFINISQLLLIGVFCLAFDKLCHFLQQQSLATFCIVRDRLELLSLFVLNYLHQIQVESQYPSQTSTFKGNSQRTRTSIPTAFSSSKNKFKGNSHTSPSLSLLEWMIFTTTNVIEPFCGKSPISAAPLNSSPSTADLIVANFTPPATPSSSLFVKIGSHLESYRGTQELPLLFLL